MKIKSKNSEIKSDSDFIPAFALEQSATVIAMVTKTFNGDIAKAHAWFNAKNPMLGDVSPRTMIICGRYERLQKFIEFKLDIHDAIIGDSESVQENLSFLCSTFDAQVWAKEFCKLNSASDEGVMLAWFANALMAGYDEAMRKNRAENATGISGESRD